MAQPAIDPSSPIPLYHQIAEALRSRIESCELAEGEVLEPLREAAAQFGVNLHTVRHAYAELARQGLVETRRARGTVVRARGESQVSSLERFVRDTLRQADEKFGLSPVQLARRHCQLNPNLRERAA